VVKPYLQYPQLLPRALDMLFASTVTMPWSLRMEVLRTVGLLGALEPHKYSVIVAHLQNLEKSRVAERKGSVSDNRVDFKGLMEMSAVSFISATNGFRDRADSSNSATAAGSAAAGGADGGGINRTRRGTTSTRVSSFGEAEKNAGHGQHATWKGDVLHSEVLLEDDSAEAPAHFFMYEQSVMKSLSEPATKEEVRRTPNSEDYYPRVAVTALMKILRDPSLTVHHSAVTQAIMLIFKSLGIRCVPFLDQIVPYLLQVAKKCGPGLRESILQQLALLTSIVHQNIAPFLPTLFEIVHDYWNEHLGHILILVEELAATATDAFGKYVHVVLPLLLSSLAVPKGITAAALKAAAPASGAMGFVDAQPSPLPSSLPHPLRPLEQTLRCYNSLRGVLRPHIHLIVPAICKLISQLQDLSGKETIQWQTKSIATLRRICTSARGATVEQVRVLYLTDYVPVA
jgi:FKBP12-rapamycin complex-associated protein